MATYFDNRTELCKAIKESLLEFCERNRVYLYDLRENSILYDFTRDFVSQALNGVRFVSSYISEHLTEDSFRDVEYECAGLHDFMCRLRRSIPCGDDDYIDISYTCNFIDSLCIYLESFDVWCEGGRIYVEN